MILDAPAIVSFFKPSAKIPTHDPADKNALFFNPLTRQELLQRTKMRARREGTQVFLATRGGKLVALGTTRVRRVLAVDGEAVRLSGSHAVHQRGHSGLALIVGRTYVVSIDPATGVILSATEMPQGPTMQVPAPFDFDPSSLPNLGTATVNAFFSALRRQPHIPFQYPANGCSPRATEMCRLIEEHLDPNQKDVVAKVWNFPKPGRRLKVKTENNPDCTVSWFYHVAPVVKGGGKLLVIDPSLFEKPVSVAKWRSVQAESSTEDPVYTCRAAYDFDQGTLFLGEEPDVTAIELQGFRDDLAGQIYSHGPLPYRCRYS